MSPFDAHSVRLVGLVDAIGSLNGPLVAPDRQLPHDGSAGAAVEIGLSETWGVRVSERTAHVGRPLRDRRRCAATRQMPPMPVIRNNILAGSGSAAVNAVGAEPTAA